MHYNKRLVKFFIVMLVCYIYISLRKVDVSEEQIG